MLLFISSRFFYRLIKSTSGFIFISSGMFFSSFSKIVLESSKDSLKMISDPQGHFQNSVDDLNYSRGLMKKRRRNV